MERNLENGKKKRHTISTTSKKVWHYKQRSHKVKWLATETTMGWKEKEKVKVKKKKSSPRGPKT